MYRGAAPWPCCGAYRPGEPTPVEQWITGIFKEVLMQNKILWSYRFGHSPRLADHIASGSLSKVLLPITRPPPHQSEGVSQAARGKGVCHAGQATS